MVEGSAFVIDQDRDALQSLIAPISNAEFHDAYWPDEPVVIHGALERLGAPFDDPMLRDFPALCARDRGRILFGKGSTGPKSILIENVDPYDLHEMGLSLYLPDIEPLVPSATSFLRALESSLGLAPGEARITAWASPATDGIACHFDAEEVFSIQLAGVKHFHLAESHALRSPVGIQYGPGIPPSPELYPQVAEGFPDPKDFTFSKIEMKPGTVLFVPRGMWHFTQADEDSLSISVILSPRSAAERVLEQLRTQLLQDANWRRPPYGKGADERVDDLLRALPGIAGTIRASDLAATDDGPGPEGIGPATRFQRVPNARVSLDEKADPPRAQIAFDALGARGDRSGAAPIAMSRRYAPVLAWLDQSRAAFAVEALMSRFPEIALAEHQEMLARLVRADFLRWLWFRPRGG